MTGNAYMWDLRRSPQLIPPAGRTVEQVLADFDRRIVLHQPVDYALLVGRDLLRGFQPFRTVGPRDVPPTPWLLRRELPFNGLRHDPARLYRSFAGYGPVLDRPLAGVLARYQHVGHTPGPVLAACAAAGLLAAAGVGRARRSGLRVVAWTFRRDLPGRAGDRGHGLGVQLALPAPPAGAAATGRRAGAERAAAPRPGGGDRRSRERPLGSVTLSPATPGSRDPHCRARCEAIGRQVVPAGRSKADNTYQLEVIVRIIVLGGDGFCGWPTTLHLSNRGHEVVIVDNLVRRKTDVELEVESLTPIQPLSTRLRAWHELTGREVGFEYFDVAENYHRLLTLIQDWQPDAVVHFAEQRAAPYSMKSSWHKRYTVNNNLNATNNLLSAIVEADADVHVVHLGTMGVYGYGTAGVKIPEGYLKVQIATEEGGVVESEILYPPNPGSIYHMTKTQDQLLFAYYNKNDRIRITDLHQGIVWGTQTAETALDERLINRFDYDGDYGTVLNRFLMQAAVGHPLTVHGTGGQTRAFIHLQDAVVCIQLAIENPPTPGSRVRVFNQMTESHRILDLAKLVSRLTGAEIDYVDNPRNEAPENTLMVENRQLLDLGLKPTTLEEGLLREVSEIAQRYRDRCNLDKIPARSRWTKNQ
jgi:UDP-sulfoquinovose synthase